MTCDNVPSGVVKVIICPPAAPCGTVSITWRPVATSPPWADGAAAGPCAASSPACNGGCCTCCSGGSPGMRSAWAACTMPCCTGGNATKTYSGGPAYGRSRSARSTRRNSASCCAIMQLQTHALIKCTKCSRWLAASRSMQASAQSAIKLMQAVIARIVSSHGSFWTSNLVWIMKRLARMAGEVQQQASKQSHGSRLSQVCWQHMQLPPQQTYGSPVMSRIFSRCRCAAQQGQHRPPQNCKGEWHGALDSGTSQVPRSKLFRSSFTRIPKAGAGAGDCQGGAEAGRLPDPHEARP
mmetsp:Transcript_9084/g.25381  ORF Transcript_9084/g.25381 Transcript_9084/m.25381 type:complete len:295 (+) Transcript_9084:166-1050(+)